MRPIWDAVESNQFKTALKLSSALLSKYPNSPYAIALKALILERMGKPNDALTVGIEAMELLYSSNLNIIYIDDLTLSTLQIVFQRLGRLDLATSCYEHACGKFPSKEILMGLFDCYVREYSFVKQQQTAIKLYKIAAEERFLLWAICSIQLQVLCSSGAQKLLSFAEALLKKHTASYSLHEPEAVVMYISILEQQGKYEDALEIVSGDLGSVIGIEADKLRMQGRLLARSCNYNTAAEIYQKILESRPDDWGSFLNYLDCLLGTDFSRSASTSDRLCSSDNADLQACKLTDLPLEVFDSHIANASLFVQKMQMKDGARCPFLATIEIERRCRLRGKTDSKLMEALFNYFHRFGHLSCFASDVESFCWTLTQNERAELLERFIGIYGSLSSTPLKKLGQSITIFKLKELFGFMAMLPVEELEETVMEMVYMYCKNLVLSSDLDPQENIYGEELLQIASSTLVMLYWRTKYLGYLLEAFLVLEFGLNIRKYVWQYKLSLVHLYSYVHALPLAFEWYGSLDMKNILLETASHHIVPQLLVSPLWSETSALLKDYLKFMDDYLREAADLTFLAYRHRKYSKVVEFVQFKERLDHSSHYLTARVEYWILLLKQAVTIEEAELILQNLNYGIQLLDLSSDEKLNALTFNEDLQLRPWWSPSSLVNYLSEPFEGVSASCLENLYKHQTCENESIVRKAIERKSLVPRLIHLSIQSASTSLKETVERSHTINDTKNNEEFKVLLEKYASSIGLSFDDAVKLVYGISMSQRSFKDFGTDMVVDCLNFAVFLNAWNLNSTHPLVPHQDGVNFISWNMLQNLIKICISEQLMCARPVHNNPGSQLPILIQLITESLTWHSLIIQSYIKSMFPSGKKKKKSEPGDHSNFRHLQLVRSSIDWLCDAIREVRKWLEDEINRPEDSRLDFWLSQLNPERRPVSVLKVLDDFAASSHEELGERISGTLQLWSSADVMRKIVRSQASLLSRFQHICDSKLEMLESLKRLV